MINFKKLPGIQAGKFHVLVIEEPKVTVSKGGDLHST